jgi:hypothetical protein
MYKGLQIVWIGRRPCLAPKGREDWRDQFNKLGLPVAKIKAHALLCSVALMVIVWIVNDNPIPEAINLEDKISSFQVPVLGRFVAPLYHVQVHIVTLGDSRGHKLCGATANIFERKTLGL